MKKLSLMAALLGGALLFAAPGAHAQVSTANVLKRLSQVVEKLESQKAQVLFLQVDNLKKDQISTQTYTLNEGSTYAIVAIGDQDRIQDIDLVVLDAESEVAGKDSDDSNLAIVKVKPTETQTYKIGIKGYEMSKNDGFYAIVICRLD